MIPYLLSKGNSTEKTKRTALVQCYCPKEFTEANTFFLVCIYRFKLT